ncbi:unnamed protein product [Dovyalis caffra]|uniref:Insecticidal crystal toxin domain-containing protein n=1 Tax=Dovyalis caffra TaxID=77055 RepID=A0AAV1R252_9ROSI|nr:unnamed protein product [Dovyalis caffra]
MYVTRPLSMYLRDPSALSLPPPDGPNSGVLVIQDEEAVPTCCFGLFKSDRVNWGLPFPQNKNLMVRYTQQAGEHQHVHRNSVLFFPVLNQPLSSNQYYVIERKGKHKGEAYINSKEEDMETCCFCTCISDLKPQPLDPRNIYQQFEIRHRNWGGFAAKSVASDGFPPNFLRRKGWRVFTSTSKEFQLNEAPGLNTALRVSLPDFNFPPSQKCSTPVVIGKWYCPFMFIKEGTVLKDQMKHSTYYEITLEQQWEQIFACENTYNEGNTVGVDVVVELQVVTIDGTEAVHDQRNVVDGVMWFRSISNVIGETNVGLRLEIVERMKWKQERAGWASGGERQVKVKRTEDFDGKGTWKKFRCYVLVERFALKRMDGSLVLKFDFRHTHHIRSKWEL